MYSIQIWSKVDPVIYLIPHQPEPSLHIWHKYRIFSLSYAFGFICNFMSCNLRFSVFCSTVWGADNAVWSINWCWRNCPRTYSTSSWSVHVSVKLLQALSCTYLMFLTCFLEEAYTLSNIKIPTCCVGILICFLWCTQHKSLNSENNLYIDVLLIRIRIAINFCGLSLDI